MVLLALKIVFWIGLIIATICFEVTKRMKEDSRFNDEPLFLLSIIYGTCVFLFTLVLIKLHFS